MKSTIFQMDFSLSSARAPKGRLKVARQFIAGLWRKKNSFLSPIGTIESIYSEHNDFQSTPTALSGLLRHSCTGDESPAYCRSVHPGRKGLHTLLTRCLSWPLLSKRHNPFSENKSTDLSVMAVFPNRPALQDHPHRISSRALSRSCRKCRCRTALHLLVRDECLPWENMASAH